MRKLPASVEPVVLSKTDCVIGRHVIMYELRAIISEERHRLFAPEYGGDGVSGGGHPTESAVSATEAIDDVCDFKPNLLFNLGGHVMNLIVDGKQSYQLFCPLAPGSGTSFLGVAAKNPAFRAPGSIRRE